MGARSIVVTRVRKSYIGIWELRRTGIAMRAVCPGSTATICDPAAIVSPLSRSGSFHKTLVRDHLVRRSTTRYSGLRTRHAVSPLDTGSMDLWTAPLGLQSTARMLPRPTAFCLDHHRCSRGFPNSRNAFWTSGGIVLADAHELLLRAQQSFNCEPRTGC